MYIKQIYSRSFMKIEFKEIFSLQNLDYQRER